MPVVVQAPTAPPPQVIESPAVLAFVDQPSATPTTLLSLNTADPFWLLADEFTLGTPTIDGDPDALGRVYGGRSVGFRLRMRGTPAEAQAAMAALGQRLLRTTSWLMFAQTSDADPVFFRTYASTPGDIDWENGGHGDYDVSVQLFADPFAYGARVTIPSQAIGNDPLNGGQMWTLPAILGDVETPLYLRVSPSLVARQGFRVATLALETPPAGYTMPYRFPTSTFVNGTDTTVPTNNAAYINSDARSTSFATTTASVTRLNTSGPIYVGANSVDLPPGSYQLFARVRGSDTSSSYTITAVQSAVSTGLTHTNEPAVFNNVGGSSTAFSYVNLGLIHHPLGAVPTADEMTRYSAHAALNPLVHFHASRTAGSGALVWDDVLLQPVDFARQFDAVRSSPLIDLGAIASSTVADSFVIDGENHMVRWLLFASNRLVPSVCSLRGGWPRVVPGMTNILHIASSHAGRGDSNVDVLTHTRTVQADYLPRFVFS